MEDQDPTVEHEWRARTLRPVIGVYVAGVFVAFMVLAHFVFHSGEAVTALFFTAVGSLVALLPNMLARVEYRLTEAGLEKRPGGGREGRPFKKVFDWDELSHFVPTGSGYKFYKRIGPSGAVSRMMKLHILGDHSGEFHVERDDLPQVKKTLEHHRIPLSGPAKGRRLGPGEMDER